MQQLSHKCPEQGRECRQNGRTAGKALATEINKQQLQRQMRQRRHGGTKTATTRVSWLSFACHTPCRPPPTSYPWTDKDRRRWQWASASAAISALLDNRKWSNENKSSNRKPKSRTPGWQRGVAGAGAGAVKATTIIIPAVIGGRGKKWGKSHPVNPHSIKFTALCVENAFSLDLLFAPNFPCINNIDVSNASGYLKYLWAFPLGGRWRNFGLIQR